MRWEECKRKLETYSYTSPLIFWARSASWAFSSHCALSSSDKAFHAAEVTDCQWPAWDLAVCPRASQCWVASSLNLSVFTCSKSFWPVVVEGLCRTRTGRSGFGGDDLTFVSLISHLWLINFWLKHCWKPNKYSPEWMRNMDSLPLSSHQPGWDHQWIYPQTPHASSYSMNASPDHWWGQVGQEAEVCWSQVWYWTLDRLIETNQPFPWEISPWAPWQTVRERWGWNFK